MSQLVPHDRTRTDQAHLALQDVQKLGEFVQAQFPQHVPNGRDTWIVRELALLAPYDRIFRIFFQMLLQNLIAIDDHGPKLPAVELTTVKANAAMTVKHRPLIALLNEQRQSEHQQA
ncbi:hypothetical protein TW83_16450 [Paracoccus sp. S4493]|nr:hypothetical protein TW83_16450 [Paracoccus sp. S4493]